MGESKLPEGKLAARRGTVSTTTDKRFYAERPVPKRLYANIAVHSRESNQILKTLPNGTQFVLIRNPNPRRPYSIGVYHDGRHFGWVPHNVCIKIAPLIDAGKFVICTKLDSTSVEFLIAED